MSPTPGLPFAHLQPVSFNTSLLRDEMVGHGIKILNASPESESDCDVLKDRFVIIGIPDDRGVALNQGFVGAAAGPEAFRHAFYRLYDRRLPNGLMFGSSWVDLGDVLLADNISDTHARLADIVHSALAHGARRVFVIGGGHDFSFGSYTGHARSCQGVLPIINFDAHFDLRPVVGGQINSGTPFRRVLDAHPARVLDGRAIFEIGIQRERNPQSLWDYAQARGISVAEYCGGSEAWTFWNLDATRKRCLTEQVTAWLSQWTGRSDFSGDVHLSIDLDVFNVAAAMGTSASTSFGVPVETLWPCMEDVLSRKMCRVVDVAELCPARDSQMQTARLAAAVVLRGALSLELTLH